MPEHQPARPYAPQHLTAVHTPSVPDDVASLLFSDAEPATREGRRTPVQWAVDRYFAGDMRAIEARLWFRLSRSFREAVDLWTEVVDVELRLLSRRVARLEAESSVLARVQADRAEAGRFWQVVRTAW